MQSNLAVEKSTEDRCALLVRLIFECLEVKSTCATLKTGLSQWNFILFPSDT